MKKSYSIILLLLILFTGFNMYGQALTKQIDFQNITFRTPDKWIIYRMGSDNINIMAPDGLSEMMIFIGEGERNKDVSPIISKIMHENKTSFVNNRLSWTFNSFEGIASGYQGNAPAKGFNASALISGGNYINVSAISITTSSINKPYLKIFENILKSIKKQ